MGEFAVMSPCVGVFFDANPVIVRLALILLTAHRPWTGAHPGPFYQRYDTNADGFHSKKEFYYAIMEDDFEALAGKYDKVCY